MTYDDAHTRNLADAVLAFVDQSAPLHVRVACGWRDGTGHTPHWSGFKHLGLRACARCAGRGFVLVEQGASHD